jgi:HNH endonuclease
VQQSKQCAVCATTFHPTPGRSRAQWERQRFCSTACANAWRARQQVKLDSTTRAEGERWAGWWERQRHREDRDELQRWKPRRWPQCRLTTRPKVRHFLGQHCSECGVPFVAWDKKGNFSTRCSPCTKARWRETHYQRAIRYGAQFDVVNPHRVFERDSYRCQLCKRQTSGKWPDPRSPSLDHIIPMARGGHHTIDNLQCACLRCNVTKGANSANDQLLLAI